MIGTGGGSTSTKTQQSQPTHTGAGSISREEDSMILDPPQVMGTTPGRMTIDKYLTGLMRRREGMEPAASQEGQSQASQAVQSQVSQEYQVPAGQGFQAQAGQGNQVQVGLGLQPEVGQETGDQLLHSLVQSQQTPEKARQRPEAGGADRLGQGGEESLLQVAESQKGRQEEEAPTGRVIEDLQVEAGGDETGAAQRGQDELNAQAAIEAKEREWPREREGAQREEPTHARKEAAEKEKIQEEQRPKSRDGESGTVRGSHRNLLKPSSRRNRLLGPIPAMPLAPSQVGPVPVTFSLRPHHSPVYPLSLSKTPEGRSSATNVNIDFCHNLILGSTPPFTTSSFTTGSPVDFQAGLTRRLSQHAGPSAADRTSPLSSLESYKGKEKGEEKGTSEGPTTEKYSSGSGQQMVDATAPASMPRPMMPPPVIGETKFLSLEERFGIKTVGSENRELGTEGRGEISRRDQLHQAFGAAQGPSGIRSPSLPGEASLEAMRRDLHPVLQAWPARVKQESPSLPDMPATTQSPSQDDEVTNI
ncbi:hypothetical protein BGX38DRAFT_1221490, partial [Terfezia claveryi]